MDYQTHSVTHSTGVLNGPPSGFLRVGPLFNLPALLRDLGHDPEPIFAETGFSTDQFTDPDAKINFVASSELLAHCVTATGCDHLGLLLGERVVPSILGVAGFMLPAAATVGTALRALQKHLELHDRGGVMTLAGNDSITLAGYAIHLPGVAARAQIYELSAAVICKIMRHLCGGDWKPHEVLLSRPPPSDTTPYRRFFQAPVRFDAEQCALVFPTSWLQHPIATADPLLFNHLKKEATEIHSTQAPDPVADLRLLLHKSLLDHQCDARSIAREMGMHERTLNRRLHESGTTFRKMLEAVRYEIARQLLTNPDMPTSRIAEALNYADSTAFSRAFKRWSGVSPTEWRTGQR